MIKKAAAAVFFLLGKSDFYYQNFGKLTEKSIKIKQ